MLSVGSILAGAFGLVRRNPLAVLVWGLLYTAAIASLFFAMRPVLQVYGEMISQQMAKGPGAPMDPEALQPFMARLQAAGGLVFLAEIGIFVLIMVLFTAAQRAVLRPAERGFFYLRVGGDELRMIALGFFVMVCIYIGSFVASLVLILFGAILAFALGSPGAVVAVFLLCFLALMGAITYFEVRVSLAFPLTFLRGTFVFADAWRLTKGRFWTLFGAYFVIMLVYMLLASILLGVVVAPFFSALASAGDNQEAMQAAVSQEAANLLTFGPRMIAILGGAVVTTGLTIGLFGGAIATAARDLAPDEAKRADTFA
ncbi:MAG TPA: hypothetical protein VIT38_07275 [Allosphingosinicella sp.]|jgi:hypothetical protein